MIDERRETQASLYALGVLPPNELPEFEQELRRNLELQLLVQDLNTSANLLLFGLPQAEAPPGLKAAIFKQINGDSAESAPVVLSWWDRLAWPAPVPWILAGSFAVLCVLLFFTGNILRQKAVELTWKLDEVEQESVQLRRHNAALEHQLGQKSTNAQAVVAEAREQLARRVQDFQKQKVQLETQLQRSSQDSAQSRQQIADVQRRLDAADKQIEQLQLLLPGGNGSIVGQLRVGILNPTADGPTGASGVSIWNSAEQKGILVLQNLPALPADKDYQLWLFDSRYAGPVSAGIVPATDRTGFKLEFKTVAQVDSAERFAISVERKGGVPSPQGKVVMLSN
ncbi:MAG: Anti-sigma-K factor rskA [Verrucomicrobiales bacterium]|nr:Anti-sigma-K factor rskA [Verrucomicrobiales bacterium]